MGEFGISGHVAEGFELVRTALEENFALYGENCAAVCVYLGGELVVSLQGGRTPQGWRYTTGTRQGLLCASKGLISLTAHLLAGRGLIDLDRPITHYWPEFGQNGKDGITLGMVLNQTSGVVSAGAPTTLAELLDWQAITRRIAAAEPSLAPGSRHAYAFHTFGLITGEVVRRACGVAISDYFREAIAEPLGVDLVLRLPEEERCVVSPILIPEGVRHYVAGLSDLARDSLHLNGAVEITEQFINDPVVATADLPGTVGYGTAEGLARLYAAVLDGSIGGMPSLAEARFDRVEVAGVDATVGAPMKYGPGFMLGGGSGEPGARADWFGFAGGSGTLGFGDQAKGLAAAYVSNRFSVVWHDQPRTRNIVNAVYSSLHPRPHADPSGRC